MEQSGALPLIVLSEQFAKLPGIGMKSAQRLAYHVMEMDEADAKAFISAFEGARKKIKSCRVCLNFTDREVCPICSSPKRDQRTICVVESPKDVMAMERVREF
ncbi:MAG: recombination protein RecR, partial [Ruminococcus sp.]|nr:recombination protein RecR [Ruminococcus sp.]